MVPLFLWFPESSLSSNLGYEPMNPCEVDVAPLGWLSVLEPEKRLHRLVYTFFPPQLPGLFRVLCSTTLVSLYIYLALCQGSKPGVGLYFHKGPFT